MDDNILDSFVSYRSYHESLKELPIEQYGRLMFAINEYALYGREPQFTSPIDKALWVAIYTGVKHSREISITRSKASKLRKSFGGGAPLNNNNAAKPEQIQSETTTKQQQNNNKAEQNNTEGRREKGEGRRDMILHYIQNLPHLTMLIICLLMSFGKPTTIRKTRNTHYRLGID